MKIRNGFVSNSSSSSFLMIGFKVPSKEDQDVYEIVEEFNETSEFKLDNLGDDDSNYVGRIIFDISDDDGGIEEIDISEIEVFKNNVEEYEDKIIEMFGVSPDVKVFGGMRYC